MREMFAKENREGVRRESNFEKKERFFSANLLRTNTGSMNTCFDCQAELPDWAFGTTWTLFSIDDDSETVPLCQKCYSEMNKCKMCGLAMREKEVHWMWDGSVARDMPMPPEWLCSACDKAGMKAS